MNVTTRRAVAADAHDLIALGSEFDPNMSTEFGHVADSLQSNPTEEVYVALVDGGLAGFAVLQVSRSFAYGRPVAELTNLYISPSRRRQRVATQLLETVRHRCEALDCLEVFLRVNRRNTAAVKLYERCGMKMADHRVYRYKYYD